MRKQSTFEKVCHVTSDAAALTCPHVCIQVPTCGPILRGVYTLKGGIHSEGGYTLLRGVYTLKGGIQSADCTDLRFYILYILYLLYYQHFLTVVK